MTIETLMTAMNTVASTIVLWSAICATNHMCRQTTFLVRAAYIMLGVGAAAVLLAPGYLGRPPTWAELLLICGLALLSIGDRRRRHTRKLQRAARHTHKPA